MKPTEQQIQERARQIGERPYHPIQHYYTPDSCYEKGYAIHGITIRFELMRTAMASIIPIVEQDRVEHGLSIASESASQYANAMLLEMARQELGVGDE
jgi:hypothetical protein